MSAEDIAERMRTGAALQQALREMEAIMRNAPVGILFTRERRIVRTNARFAEVFGYAADELIGAPARVLYRSDADYEALGREAGPLLARQVQNRDDPGEGTIWICEDRSSVKRTEEALKRAHAEQHLILDNSVVGIAFIRHRLFQRCNRRLEEIYGWGRGELDGQPTRVVFFSDEAHERAGSEVYEALRRGETFSNELIQQRRDGEPFWVRVTGKAIDAADPIGGSIWNFETCWGACPPSCASTPPSSTRTASACSRRPASPARPRWPRSPHAPTSARSTRESGR